MRRRSRSTEAEGVTLEARVLKVMLRPMGRWATKRALLGRYLDPDDSSAGRITPDQVDRVLGRTWEYYDELVPGARVRRLPTRGSRQNVLLGVFSLALHRALVAEGIERKYATTLVTDLAWKVYEKWFALPRIIARLTRRDPQKRMNMVLRMFLRFPFGRPGYDWKARSGPDEFALDIYRCPVRDYLQSQGEGEFMLNSWCTLDFALAQVMTKGGHYRRPHTLSAGDPVCDMRWIGREGGSDEPREPSSPDASRDHALTSG